MLDRLLKDKINMLANELLNKDYRIENITITFDDDFIYVELLLKIGDEYTSKPIRIMDMVGGLVYDDKSIYNSVKSAILHFIEYEYAKQLAGVLNG